MPFEKTDSFRQSFRKLVPRAIEAPKAIKFVGHQGSTEGGKQFGTYTIRCQDRDGHEWTCEKRYSEFAALDEELR